MYTNTHVLHQRGSDPIACKTLCVWRDAVRDMAAAWAAFAVPTPGNVSKASFLRIIYSSFTIKQGRPKHGGFVCLNRPCAVLAVQTPGNSSKAGSSVISQKQGLQSFYTVKLFS